MQQERILHSFEKHSLDGFVSFLPENILAFSGYWPSTGNSAILYPAAAKPLLIVPFPDDQFVPASFSGEVIIYHTGLDKDPAEVQVINHLKAAFAAKNLGHARIGCVKSMQTVAGTHIGGEAHVHGLPFFGALESALPDVIFEDHTALLNALKMVKTPSEIQSIKKCHEIVEYALGEAKAKLQPGMKESALSAIIEGEIQTFGIGYQGVGRARGYAFVMSGADNTANAWLDYNISTDRVIEEGDLILIELDTHADGYWSDISRTFVAGSPDQKQTDVLSAILKSLYATVEALKNGMGTEEIDNISRKVLWEEGLAEYYRHHVGHGVGYAFHEAPYLDPPENMAAASTVPVEAGMVFAIEPGIYIPGWGGIRIEDNVVMTAAGKAEYLSNFERGF